MRRLLWHLGLRLRRAWPAMAGIALGATLLAWGGHVLGLPGFATSEVAAYDEGLRHFSGRAWFPWGRAPRSDDVVIVAIDDKTFIDVKAHEPWRMRYGTWPYDRLLWADVLEYLQRAGARQVVFDTSLDEPHLDATGDIALGETLQQLRIPFATGFNVIPRVDPLPKAGPRPAPRPIAPPLEGDGLPAPEDTTSPEAKAARLARVASLYAFPVEVRGGLALPRLPAAHEVDDQGVVQQELPRFPVPAIDALLDAAAGWGLVLLEEDRDGKMRRTRFAYSDGTNTYVTLPVVAAAQRLGATSLVLEPGRLRLGSHVVAIDDDGAAWVDYGGPFDTRYRTISLASVLRAMERPGLESLFEGKTVFVGGFALGTADVKATPLESQVPGVVKQVAVYENLVRGRFITDAPGWASVLLALAVSLLSVALDVAWPVLLYAGFSLLTGALLAGAKLHVLSAMPAFAGIVASVLATGWERLFANRERERIKATFAAYMEADVVTMMVERAELPTLDGEPRRVTAFFSDIKGFSTFSEALRDDPKGLVRLLNRYLSTVTPALTEQGACIDKFIGDAVVALFGAPVDYPDHAWRACMAALEVQRVIGLLREELRREGLPDVYTRVGLNTDVMVVGNIGSAQHLDYTAIGDGMNLAARLEATNKQYGTLILVGEQTHAEVEGRVVAREVDLVRVAGKTQPSRIYELVGLPGQVPAGKLEVLRRYAEALARYRARDFGGALEAFEAILRLDEKDGPSRTMLGRCTHFLAHPPPAAWDGVADLEK